LRDSVAVSYQDSVTTIQQFDTPNDHLIGSYEIALKDFDELYEAQRGIYDLIPFQLGIENVLEQHPEIIAWLQMLDINVIIIIVLMIVISIINMTSALLIIILEKQNFIGTFKAMGMSNWQLLKVFVLHSIGLISKGLLWGNGIGLGLMLIQKYTGIIQLDPNQYYVKEVPIDIQWTYILALNIGVILVCALAMMLPAAYVSKIRPIKAIRFN
jgi:lipoprotein-releasing system permease protein